MERAAEVSGTTGILSTRVSGEPIRQTVLRLGINGERANHGITRPDPAVRASERTKGSATA